MSMYFREDPYDGLAASIITSNVIDLRGVGAWTYSYRTTSGTTSMLTLQVSNGTGDVYTAPLNAGFSNSTGFITLTPSLTTGPVPVMFGRFLRNVSSASLVIDVSKMQWLGDR